MEPIAAPDKRSRRRSRMLKSGKIVIGKTVVPCSVRNLSDIGACLQLQTTYGIPATFGFQIDDQPARACKVAWLDDTKIGIHFV